MTRETLFPLGTLFNDTERTVIVNVTRLILAPAPVPVQLGGFVLTMDVAEQASVPRARFDALSTIMTKGAEILSEVYERGVANGELVGEDRVEARENLDLVEDIAARMRDLLA